MQKWQLQEAKAKFSELVRLATTEGPQEITVRGKEMIVVLSKREFDSLSGAQESFWDFMSASPLKGIELDFERDKSLPRDVTL